MEDESKETLTAPLQFFVEVGTYVTMTGTTPDNTDLIAKEFQGMTLNGVSWTYIYYILSVSVLGYSKYLLLILFVLSFESFEAN